MKKIDILGISFDNFKRRKTRSILSVLGVVIGTASIVIMMSLGIAMNVSFQEQLSQGGNMNQIRVSAKWDETTGKQIPLTDETIESIRTLENVSAISPTVRLDGKIFSGKYQTWADVMGIDLSYVEAMGIQVTQGRMMTGEDISTGKNIYCLMSTEFPYNLQKPVRYSGMMGGVVIGGGNGDLPEGVEVPENGWYYGGIIYDSNGKEVGTYPPPVDVMDELTPLKYTYDYSYGEHSPGEELTVTKRASLFNLIPIGMLERNRTEAGVYIDIDTAIRLKKEYNKWMESQYGSSTGASKKETFSYDQILVLSDNLNHTMELTEQIKQLGLNAYSSADYITQMQQTQNMLQMVLAGIGGVSLLVAAIGITNTMVMSIYERTREIGIMKVIGCYLKDIRTMFLTEAGIIGFFGGLFGVGLSYAVSAVLNWTASSGSGILGGILGGMGTGMKLSVIPWWLALLAIAFAIFVALVSGFFPARRAMRLSALEAMGT